jgi:hypothetical protein
MKVVADQEENNQTIELGLTYGRISLEAASILRIRDRE